MELGYSERRLAKNGALQQQLRCEKSDRWPKEEDAPKEGTASEERSLAPVAQIDLGLVSREHFR